MLKEHATFYSESGKRRVLVVDDQLLNREILKNILESKYEVLQAEDGVQAIEIIQDLYETLSLVVLDLIMPNLSGTEVLKRIKSTPEWQNIPVIVASADVNQEIDCLNLGAGDFISKPYPDSGVVLARVQRTIELSEDREIIRSTERDPITGLYNREFFINYAEQFDLHHKDTETDAILIDINHFSIINERYGRKTGDEVLRRVGEKLRECVHGSGGIVCRRSADTFWIYCPHRDDYKAIIDNASVGLVSDGLNSRVRLRMGVYSNADKKLDMERRFDRAKSAADTVHHSYTRNIGVYDDSLLKTELYHERLIEMFPTALEEKQFLVYYQPKFDVTGDVPVLAGAEALVRWKHPEQGLINPGVFIPLFESNGLIQKLDQYVWREAARQIREWKDTIGFSVPVSVNASRIDMYDPAIIPALTQILKDYNIESADLHLEITESAYTEDTEQIVETVKQLRALGFKIEMDDFGTGYSSLNMISKLPIDALKLDMIFIRTAFSQQNRDTHMVEVILDIAEHLNVPSIAEGVETEEQLKTLKSLGCELIQGYYFSPPVPHEKFESFLYDEVHRCAEEQSPKEAAKTESADSAAVKAMLSSSEKAAFWHKLPGMRLKTVSYIFIVAAIISAVLLFNSDSKVNRNYKLIEDTGNRYLQAQQAAADLEGGSDYLTVRVRSFVITGDYRYLEDYFEEVNETKRRDDAVKTIKEIYSENEAYAHLSKALDLSNELMDYEYRAMRYIMLLKGYDLTKAPAALQQFELSEKELEMTEQELGDAARELVFGDSYMNYKERISEESALCCEALLSTSDSELFNAEQEMQRLLRMQTVLTVLFIVIAAAYTLFIAFWVRLPLTDMVRHMKAKKSSLLVGAEELRYVAGTYNEYVEETTETYDRLTDAAMRDALTGLLNRAAYDTMRGELDMSHAALMLVDVDKFKGINDTYGHDVGDKILKNVASVLKSSFSPEDLYFRLGGDEFVVILHNADSSMREQVRSAIEQANVMLQSPSGDLPACSLSVGVAFADRPNPQGDIFKDADTALYRVKSEGRRGCMIF